MDPNSSSVIELRCSPPLPGINTNPCQLTVSYHISQICKSKFRSPLRNLVYLSMIHLSISMYSLNVHAQDCLSYLAVSFFFLEERKKEPGKISETQRTNKGMTRQSNELSKKAKVQLLNFENIEMPNDTVYTKSLTHSICELSSLALH